MVWCGVGLGRSRNKQIEAQIAKEKAALENEVKMLILGTGESGKSTVMSECL